jgi:hypothetical protein
LCFLIVDLAHRKLVAREAWLYRRSSSRTL